MNGVIYMGSYVFVYFGNIETNLYIDIIIISIRDNFCIFHSRNALFYVHHICIMSGSIVNC